MTRLAPCVVAVLLAGSAVAATAAPPAEVRRFKLGAMELIALKDGQSSLPNDGKVFGVDKGEGAAAVGRVLARGGGSADKIELSINVLLVRLPGRLIMLDTGWGPQSPTGGALGPSLAKAGVSPTAITDIVISHGHGDHVGGLLTPAGALAFPNAAIRLSVAEWAAIQVDESPRARALVTAITPKVEPFMPGATIAPGVTAVDIAGHTPGHSGVELVSGGKRLLAIGDMAHSHIVSVAEPEFTIAYDKDAPTAEASRRATLARVASSKSLMFAPHFPFPGVGRVVTDGKGFAWRPATE